jgi:hypothetical protein
MLTNILEFLKNNKIVIFLLFLVGIVIYYMKYKEGFKETQVDKPSKNEKFIPSDKFNGAKKGYIFKNDKLGLGYYIDSN